MATRPRARRMSPKQRREQILDSAVDLIIHRGPSHCSLENVAEHAGISKPLIYKYFTKREELLKAILEREYEYLGARGLAQVPADTPPERLVRAANERALTYLYERGPILRILGSDRSIANLVEKRVGAERRTIVSYFTERMHRAAQIPEDVAAICSIMTVNAPILAASQLQKQNIPAARAAEVWSEFVLAGWRALAAKFAESPQGRTNTNNSSAARTRKATDE